MISLGIRFFHLGESEESNIFCCPYCKNNYEFEYMYTPLPFNKWKIRCKKCGVVGPIGNSLEEAYSKWQDFSRFFEDDRSKTI